MRNFNYINIIFALLVSFVLSSCIEVGRNDDQGSWNVTLETGDCICDLEIEEIDNIEQEYFEDGYNSMIFSNGMKMLVRAENGESFVGSIENFNKSNSCQANIVIFLEDGRKLELAKPETIDAGGKHEFTLWVSDAVIQK